MNTLEAFMLAQANQGGPIKVFDWVKAARIIKERRVVRASAGLWEDWGWTGGEIWCDGAPVPEGDTYTYLLSNWATPVLMIHEQGVPIIEDTLVECYVVGDETEWDQKTYWPEEALEIVRQKV